MSGIPKLGPVIAIDGPAGTGKSSATLRLCERLGFTHVDTGALYRAIAHCVGPLREEEDVEILNARATEVARSAHLEFHRMPERTPANRVFVNGSDVTELIRTPEVSLRASRVAAIPGVRAALLGLQRRLGCQGKTILEGRDIGTVVFPDADLKVFLTARPDVRAARRLEELRRGGKPVPSLDEMRRQIELRDSGDSQRAVAPLKRAEDALEIDTSDLTLEQVVEAMVQAAVARVPGLKPVA
jgi:cytidylate kinase